MYRNIEQIKEWLLEEMFKYYTYPIFSREMVGKIFASYDLEIFDCLLIRNHGKDIHVYFFNSEYFVSVIFSFDGKMLIREIGLNNIKSVFCFINEKRFEIRLEIEKEKDEVISKYNHNKNVDEIMNFKNKLRDTLFNSARFRTSEA